MIRRFALASAILIAAGSAAPAMAGSATNNLTVSSNVANNCTISASTIAFGAYDPIIANSGPSEDLDVTGTVTVTCTSGAPVTITLGQGNNPGSGSTDASPMRRLNNGANYLSYGIYQNIGHTTVWGNTAGTGVSHTGIGSASNLSVFGRIDSGQNVPAGSYTDTVVATVTF